jgi:DNA-binding NtrC family response regulator
MKPRVLLVEDDVERGGAMVRVFSRSFECRHVTTVEEAVAVLQQGRWAALVVNYGLAGGWSGLEVLQIAYETLPRTFRLLYNDVYSPSFLHDAERTVQPHFTSCAAEPDFQQDLHKELEVLLEPPAFDLPADLEPILTDVLTARAPVSRRYVEALRAAAGHDGPVYIYGEPGTGVTRSGIVLRRWRRERKARGEPATGGRDCEVSILRVPALRERPQDLPLLAGRCLLEEAQQGGGPVRRLSPRAVEELLSRDWYGNIVELSAVLLRAIQRAGPRVVIEAEDLPRDAQPAWRPSQYAKDAGQRDCVLRQLRIARNVSAAARLEGCSRANYIRLLRRLGIIRADLVAETRPVAKEPTPDD